MSNISIEVDWNLFALFMYVCIYVFAYLFILHCIALRFFPERYAVV